MLIQDTAAAAAGTTEGDSATSGQTSVAIPLLIGRKAIGETLQALAERLPDTELRPAVLATLRQAHNDGRAEIRKLFEASNSGEDCVRRNCELMDTIIRALADFAEGTVFPSAGPSTSETFDIAATGGYGRGELSPHSDIDLLFLLPYKCPVRVEQIVEYMLYMLWDLGLKVGHAVRSVDECLRQAKIDVTIRTNLLETRPLWGDGALLVTMRRRLAKEVIGPNGPAFVVAKLAERDDRHQRMGDSRYVLEPNVKEGKGGLRDLQTLLWIAKYLYKIECMNDLVANGVLLREEANRFIKAQNFL